jgi:hypothetical protein
LHKAALAGIESDEVRARAGREFAAPGTIMRAMTDERIAYAMAGNRHQSA